MAAHADIKRKDIQDNFIGFLAYSAGMVADYGLKTRGKGAGHAMIRAELDDWTGWSAGVAEFKRFMSKASRCPTTAPPILKFQAAVQAKKARNAKKKAKKATKAA